MAPVTPYLPGLATTFFGRAQTAAHQHFTATRQRLQRASCCQLARMFRELLPAHALAPAARHAHSRRRIYTMEATFWVFLAQMLSPHVSCREAVRRVAAWYAARRQPLPSSNTAAYCMARKKLPLQRLRMIHQHVANVCEERTARTRWWHRHRVLVVDGTCVAMPDAPANQRAYPQPAGQKKGCGFPVVKLVALFSMASGALLEWVEGTWRQQDAALWRALWHMLAPGDVIVCDRGFCSFAALAALSARGVHMVVRLHQGRTVPHFAKGRCERVVTWRKPQRPTGWSREEWDALPAQIDVRIVRVRVARKGFRTRTLLIATTLLDAMQYPAEAVAELYLRRWTVELYLRDIKTSMGMDVLTGRSPEMIRREICMFVLAYNLVRAVMQDAADACQCELTRLSFKGTMDTVRQWCAHGAEVLRTPRATRAYYEALLHMIAADPVPWRPWRVEPRAVKRRPKSYRLLNKPRHRMYVPPHHNRPKTRLRRCA